MRTSNNCLLKQLMIASGIFTGLFFCGSVDSSLVQSTTVQFVMFLRTFFAGLENTDRTVLTSF